MLALISPAKKLDFDSEISVTGFTQPVLLDHSKELVKTLKKLKANDLKKLMKLSDNLSELNYDRYQSFSTPFKKTNARTAATAFKGDTYVGLDADTLSKADLTYAKNHLGILSGLYGLLRPSDLMQAYRLEMGTRLPTTRGKNLYDFWGDIITDACNDRLKRHKNKTVISLASNEYIKAIKQDELIGGFITCEFKELKDGKPKTIGFFAKKARGMMARYLVQKRIETPAGLKKFKEDGYKFASSLSDKETYVFLRESQ